MGASTQFWHRCHLHSKHLFPAHRRRWASTSNHIQRVAVERLKQHGVTDAEDSVRFLWVAAKGNGSKFNEFIERRTKREPVQYIIGEWDFHNITVETRWPVLIPRPETEEFVEYIIEELKNHEHYGKAHVLDVGAGTGAIGLALLKARAIRSCVGIDINPVAVELANTNAKKLGLESSYRCIQGDIGLYAKTKKALPEYDHIVSNPPYIPSNLIKTLQEEVRNYESHLALDGGPNGDDIFLEIVRSIPRLLKPGGKAFFELHETHTSERVQQIVKNEKTHGVTYAGHCRDFAHIERFHQLRYKN